MVSPYLVTEARIIKIGIAIRGFTSSRDCVNKLRAAGYSYDGDAATAIWREVKRQQYTGRRPTIKATYDPPPIPLRSHDWKAVCDGYDAGGPVGYGATELEAILDLVQQVDERAAA